MIPTCDRIRRSTRLVWVKFLLALCAYGPAAVAVAQEQMPTGSTLGEVLPRMAPMFLMVFFIFYFLVIRPQQSKLKEQQSLHQSLKKGDTVTTTGGLIGRISTLTDDEVHIEVANGVRLRFERAHIVKRIEEKAPSKTAA
jgi:preprotein translocase subunit YajC